MIWLPHCHPSKNDWQFEGCPDERITPELVANIRHEFSSQALTASTWRLFDRLGLMERPRLAACLRIAYRTLFKPWKRLRERTAPHEKTGRLVDKSVHAGLWLNLVDAVFPDALYIHMIRSPETCVPSMIRGWQANDRFQTYRIPEQFTSKDSADSAWWCFPMPTNWRDHFSSDLIDTCTFQWTAIHDSILQWFSHSAFNGRSIRIHLENLITNSDAELRRLCHFLQLDPSLLQTDSSGLPKINASLAIGPIDEPSRQRILESTSQTYHRLLQ